MKFFFRTRSRVYIRTVVLLSAALASIYLQIQYHKVQNKPARMKAAAFFPMVVPESPKPAPPEPMVTTLRIERNETFSNLMGSLGMDSDTASQIYESASSVYDLKKLQAGAALTLTSADGDHFSRLEYPI